MDFKDYYKILGVVRDANQKSISAAYRKLARQYHPDVNKARGAEERFKGINEAYQVLGDPEKRSRYEQMYDLYQRGGADWASVFGGIPSAGRTGTFHVDLGDLGGFSEFFQQFFGDLGGELFGNVGGAGRAAQPPRSHEQPMEISLEEAYHGVRKRITVPVNGERQGVEVNIPAGVRTGQRIRLAGAVNGRDLFLTVNVRAHPLFERREDDIYVEVPITLVEAMLGAEIEVPTLDGKVKMRIPPETRHDQLFRLRGQGMPKVRGGGRGDHHARAKVVLPERLSARERQLFEELGRTRKENPRVPLGCK